MKEALRSYVCLSKVRWLVIGRRRTDAHPSRRRFIAEKTGGVFGSRPQDLRRTKTPLRRDPVIASKSKASDIINRQAYAIAIRLAKSICQLVQGIASRIHALDNNLKYDFLVKGPRHPRILCRIL